MLGFSVCLVFAGLLAVSAFMETKPNKNILIGVHLLIKKTSPCWRS